MAALAFQRIRKTRRHRVRRGITGTERRCDWDETHQGGAGCIPQVVRNNRSPSSSARTPTVKPISPRVNASAHNAAEGDKKSFLILPPELTAKPPPFAAKDGYSRIRC
jgi:hypothetical protein